MKINNILLLTIESDDINTSGIPIEVDYARGNYPPLGLMYLASELIKNGYNPKILDLASFNKSHVQIISFIKRFSPEVVGIQLYSTSIRNAIIIARLIKENFPNIIIVTGGPHLDAYPRETISLPLFDIGIFGEGTIKLVNVLKNIKSGKPLDHLDGIVFKSNENVLINPPKSDLTNFNKSTFPAREALENKSYKSIFEDKFTSIITSTGCRYSCIFCSDSNRIKIRSYENVIQEIEHCIDIHNINHFYFVDNNFPVYNKKWIKQFCNGIIDKKIRISWSIRTRADSLSNESLLIMKKAGCNRLQLGIESANSRSIGFIGKKLNLKLAEKGIKLAKKHGFTILTYFIIGFPDEDEGDIINSIRFAKKINSDYAHFSILTPMPNTRLYQYARKEGVIKNDYWLDYMTGKVDCPVPTVSKKFTREELNRHLTNTYLSFYFDLRFISKRILLLLKEENRFSNLIKSAIGLGSLLRMRK